MANQSKFQEQEPEGSDQKPKKTVRKKKCVSPSCNYNAPDGFFGFPKKDFLKKKWLEALGLSEDQVKSYSQGTIHILRNHF